MGQKIQDRTICGMNAWTIDSKIEFWIVIGLIPNFYVNIWSFDDMTFEEFVCSRLFILTIIFDNVFKIYKIKMNTMANNHLILLLILLDFKLFSRGLELKTYLFQSLIYHWVIP